MSLIGFPSQRFVQIYVFDVIAVVSFSTPYLNDSGVEQLQNPRPAAGGSDIRRQPSDGDFHIDYYLTIPLVNCSARDKRRKVASTEATPPSSVTVNDMASLNARVELLEEQVRQLDGKKRAGKLLKDIFFCIIC